VEVAVAVEAAAAEVVDSVAAGSVAADLAVADLAAVDLADIPAAGRWAVFAGRAVSIKAGLAAEDSIREPVTCRPLQSRVA
jgi:hypothetical protein